MSAALSRIPEIDRVASPRAATRDDLLQEYAPLVRRVAYKLAARLPHSVEIDDLISSGVIGLIDAIDKFDPSRSTHFRSYAEIRIRGAILDELRALDWVPRSVRQRAGEIEAAYTRIERAEGRKPTEDEVADELGLTLDELRTLADRVKPVSVVSFEDLGGGAGESRSALDCIEDASQPDPHCAAVESGRREHLEGALRRLPEKQRTIMSLYYFEDLNLKEIGSILGVTESRVSQLRSKAIAELRGLVQGGMSAANGDVGLAMAA